MSSSKVESMHWRQQRPWPARFAFVLALGAFLAGVGLAPAEAGGEIVSPQAGLTVALGSANVSVFLPANGDRLSGCCYGRNGHIK